MFVFLWFRSVFSFVSIVPVISHGFHVFFSMILNYVFLCFPIGYLWFLFTFQPQSSFSKAGTLGRGSLLGGLQGPRKGKQKTIEMHLLKAFLVFLVFFFFGVCVFFSKL